MTEINNTANRPIPVMYADGFNSAIGASDLEITVALRDQPMAKIIVGHAVAKQLHMALGDLLSQFESLSGQRVPLLADLATKLTGKSPSGRIIM